MGPVLLVGGVAVAILMGVRAYKTAMKKPKYGAAWPGNDADTASEATDDENDDYEAERKHEKDEWYEEQQQQRQDKKEERELEEREEYERETLRQHLKGDD